MEDQTDITQTAGQLSLDDSATDKSTWKTSSCANCGTHEHLQLCTKCRSVSYCGEVCRTADYQDHKKECNAMQDRQSVYRAGSLLQKIWYIISEANYSLPLWKVEKKVGMLLIYFDYSKLQSMRRHQKGWVVRFPNELFVNEQDKAAVLSCCFCNDSIAHTHRVASWLFKGWCKSVEELIFVVKDVSRQACMVERDGAEDEVLEPVTEHEVLLITLWNAEKYIIDLTGAQYGWFEPVTPFDDYEEQRIGRTRERNASGACRDFMRSSLLKTNSVLGPSELAVRRHNTRIGERFGLELEAWAARTFNTPTAFLGLPDADYAQQKQRLLGEARGQIDIAVTEFDSQWLLNLRDTMQDYHKAWQAANQRKY